MLCADCGGEFKNVGAHKQWCKGGSNVAVADKPETSLEERAARAQERRGGRSVALPAIDQVRPFNQSTTSDKTAAAYYLRTDGATIADALVYYPNGAQLSQEDDPKGKYSRNAAYYQARQARKGFEYIGPTLTVTGCRRLVEVLAQNQPDEIERLEDEIALCELTIKNADRPEIRDHERRRRTQLQARLERVRAPFDPDALAAQLEEIANAQEMANVPPAVMRVMRRMLEAQGKRINDEVVSRFAKSSSQDDATGLTSIEGAASIG